MDASVVIPTYNRKRVLKDSLLSLFNQDYPKGRYEIVIVDDGSSDNTDKLIKSLSPPCFLKYLRHPQREGPSKARNYGIREANGEIIIFIDSDIICPPGFVSAHMRYHKKYRNIVVDGPAVYINNLDGNHRFQRFLARFDFFGGSFITANTSCKKEVLIKAGGFSEDFGLRFGWEDREFGFRIKQMGIKRKKARSAYAFHYQEKRDLQASIQKGIDQGINAVLYYKKHPNLRVKIETRFHYLLLDRLINVGNWLEKDIPKRLISSKILQVLLRRPFLIHAYAKGLREGIRRYYDRG
ncbi:MAG: glycosyltransferase [bacterium]|nr:glycosyltransferase [bacterium]